MALRQVVYIEDPMLRKTSRPVTKFDARLHTLLDDMAETMHSLQGVGLAAPQVAVLRQAVVMDCGTGLIEMMNPEIIETSGEQEGVEGCLSVPGRHGMVTRPMIVKVRFQDRNGEWRELEADGLLARCIMHETDHLKGQLYVDIMSREVYDYELEESPDEEDETEEIQEDKDE
ncbi:MAG: peptide deformylase [Clostridia bacterium]|nr:peptide deformylase [Clostridia bacterium]